MSKVEFIIIGAQKSGTTWLVDQLRSHEMIYLPREEVHFFDKEKHFRKGIKWYHQHFEGVKNDQLIGEKTPDYLTTRCDRFPEFPNIAERINSYSKKVKLILILRNPVQRAISAANHMIRMGHVSPFTSLHQLVGERRIKKAKEFGVLEYGNYSYFIKHYYDIFDEKQLLILNYEKDVKENPVEGLKKVSHFLQIENKFSNGSLFKKSNAFNQSKWALIAKYYLPRAKFLHRLLNKLFVVKKEIPQESDLIFLRQYYSAEHDRLEKLGVDISNWN